MPLYQMQILGMKMKGSEQKLNIAGVKFGIILIMTAICLAGRTKEEAVFPANINVEGQPYYEIVGLSREYMESRQDALLSGTLDYDTLVEGRGIIIDDSTGVVERFANYKAAIGDITQIETDEGEKLPFQVMVIMNLGDQRYKGYFIFVPQDLLNEKSKYNKFLI